MYIVDVECIFIAWKFMVCTGHRLQWLKTHKTNHKLPSIEAFFFLWDVTMLTESKKVALPTRPEITFALVSKA